MSRSSSGGGPIDEREFHAWLAEHLPAGRSGLLPLGDDAAALPPPRGRVVVLTTDALVEGTHFLAASPPERIGAAAAAVNLSDLAAKGAQPAALLLAVVVPPGTPRAWAAALTRGAERVGERFGAPVLGGDTKPGPVRGVVGIAVGWGERDRLAPRSGARPGDVLVTTGVVGRGGLAAAALGSKSRPGARTLVRMLDVEPRVAEGRALARWAHAMLDTSDGLAEATRLLARSSRCRVVVDEELLPWAPGLERVARRPSERRAIAFYGGDYELLAALPARAVGRAARAVAAVGGRLSSVGRVLEGRGARLSVQGREIAMPAAGWRPFDRARSPIGHGVSRGAKASRASPSQTA